MAELKYLSHLVNEKLVQLLAQVDVFVVYQILGGTKFDRYSNE